MKSLNNSSTSIKNWAADDRPREKLFTKGATALSDSELLAILISTGSKSKSAVELAKEVLQLGKNNLKSSNDIAEYLKATLKDYAYEVFAVVFLNRANKINHFKIISQGGITGTVADPRVILKTALEQDATAIVF